MIFYSIALDCNACFDFLALRCYDVTRIHISSWYLKFECRDTRLHAASCTAFYGLFIVGTKLITPREVTPAYRRARIIHPLRAHEGVAFLLNHTSRVLVVARLICRDAFFCGAGPSQNRERHKREKTARAIHILCQRRLIPGTHSIFTFAPRVTDVTGVRRRRKHLRPETSVWMLSVWESVTSQSNEKYLY